MENITKVDQAMKSIRQKILKTEDAQIINNSEYLREHFSWHFHEFLGELNLLTIFSQSPKIPNSEYQKIDVLIAKILLKNLRPGRK